MSQDTELIKERVDIVSLVSEYVPLKQAGQNMKGLCPFHQEKSPSFTVSPARNTWHCFGCNEGGDVFSFIQKIEGLDFPSALKLLAERAGVELKKTFSKGASTNYRQRLYDLLEEAMKFYHAILLQHKAGEKAKRYLMERGVTEQTMRQFMIGYAPMKWDIIQQRLARKKYTIEEMIAAGLVGRGQSGKLYDRFRGRIMFPVKDTQGRVVAFGGRIAPWYVTGNEGKYVNSPETSLYEKRRIVYNLHQAKHELRANMPCLVVEGYMDVVMLVQAGIKNVVATSGTAFTADHIKQLARFTKTLHFSFDADGAGYKATIAATNAALAAGMHVATVTLPHGKDPADIALEEPEKVAGYMRTTTSLAYVLLQQFKQSDESQSKESKLQALLPFVKQVRNPIQQGEMIQEIANALHVPESSVQHALDQHVDQQGVGLPAEEAPNPATASRATNSPEIQLLGILLDNIEAREAIFPFLEEHLFIDPAAKMLYNSMHALAIGREDFFTLPAENLIARIATELLSLAEATHGKGQEFLSTSTNSPVQEGRSLLKGLQRRSLASRLQVLQSELSLHGELERIDGLKKFQALAEELAAVTNSVEP